MLLYRATKSILIRMISELITTLAQARKAARITQADLAERAGLSRMAVQRTETGDVDPRFSTLQEMARVLNMELIAVPAELHAQVLALIQPQTDQTGAADSIASPVTARIRLEVLRIVNLRTLFARPQWPEVFCATFRGLRDGDSQLGLRTGGTGGTGQRIVAGHGRSKRRTGR
jgi:transcriptional regulator with XRE-family HTH domain